MRLSLVLLALLGVGCGSAPATVSPGPAGPTPTEAASASPVATPADPFAVDGALAQEQLPAEPPTMAPSKLGLPPAPAAVPPAPDDCRAFVTRRGTGAPACADRAKADEALATALATADAAERDRWLVDLESCAALPPGVVRALRAELAPTECSDGLVEPLLRQPPAGIDGVVYDALLGLGVAARLARTVRTPPTLDPPYDKARVQAFHLGPLHAWGAEQARAVQELSAFGAKLGYYGKAVVAVEAGMADMRFVEVARGMPVPTEFAGDAELLDEYYGGLDVGLEPRKSRGRDAALVGLRGLAYVGVIRDGRVTRARELLSHLYGGRPIDALDALRLPPAAEVEPATVVERLARRLPTFYAGLLLDGPAAREPAVLRQLVRQGLPLRHRIALRQPELPPELRLLVVRARLDLGRIYWRAVDFDEAVALLVAWPKGVERPPEASLLLALGLGLRGGPADAAEMIRRAPLESLGIGRVAALDELGRQPALGPASALAALDAALLLQVAAPPRAPASYWLGLAERFRQAASRLDDPSARALAAERARDAEATARAIR